LLAAAILLPAFAEPGPSSYFPETEGRNAFLQNWLGSQLRAMGEPVLSSIGERGPFTRRLRLLVAPHYRPSYAVRIDEGPTGAQLTITVLDRPGVSGTPRIGRQRQRTLSVRQLVPVLSELRRARLDAQIAQAPDRPPRLLPDGRQEIEMCVHSTYFLLELLDETGSHFVERDPCDLTPPLAALAYELVRFRNDNGAADDRAVLALQMRRPD
jgi:hypothetical protein